MIEGILNLADPRERENLIKSLRALRGIVPDKPRYYSVRIAEYRERRSGQANRFLWGVVYAAFVNFRSEQGENFTADEAHRFFGLKFLRRPVVNMDTGQVMGQTIRSTAELDTAEFSAYVEKIIAWLAEYGIEVPQAMAQEGVKR